MRLEKDKTKWKRNESCISNGNQLTSVEDSVTTPMVYSGAFNFKNGTTQTTEYVYDACGAIKQDKNKGIALIDYDFNGMPTRIQFMDGSVTENIYSAEGVKLKTIHRTAVSGLHPVYYGTRHTLTASETQSQDSTRYVNNLEIDKIYGGKFYFGNGYIALTNTGSGTFHYMVKDHLGNVRTVVNNDGTVEQVNNYLAYGGLQNDVQTGADVQTHKYNGKELDRMHGLDLYDYGARNYNAALGQFTTMDNYCEKYYHLSPYSYCGGNPVRSIDENGDSIVVSPNIQGFFDKLMHRFGFPTSYQRSVNRDIKELKELDGEVREMIEGLEKSPRIHRIRNVTSKHPKNFNKSNGEATHGKEMSTITYYNPQDWYLCTGECRPPKIGLAHELKHASDADKGLLTEDKENGVQLSEIRAIEIENRVREKLNYKKRKTYGGVEIERFK